MTCTCSFPWAGECQDCKDREPSNPDACSNDPYCACNSCQQHNLDEFKPKETE